MRNHRIRTHTPQLDAAGHALGKEMRHPAVLSTVAPHLGKCADARDLLPGALSRSWGRYFLANPESIFARRRLQGWVSVVILMALFSAGIASLVAF